LFGLRPIKEPKGELIAGDKIKAFSKGFAAGVDAFCCLLRANTN
jgi:hypothetical protein